MERKLISQGLGGITIYLPKEWIDAHKLSKGDLVSIEDSQGKLILSPSKIKKKSETTIEIKGLTESLVRSLITNAYRAGHDIINIKYTSSEQFNILQDVIEKRLIGFEIIKNSDKECKVENVTEPSEDQFDTIFQKLFMNIDSMINMTLSKLNNKPYSDEENIDVLEKRINKYDNFCRRILNKRRFDAKSGMFLSFIILITHGQRELYHLNKLLVKKKAYPKDIQDLSLAVNEIWGDIKQIYEKKELDRFVELHEAEKKYIFKKGYDLLKKSKGEDTIILFRLLSSIRKFYQANSPLMGIVY